MQGVDDTSSCDKRNFCNLMIVNPVDVNIVPRDNFKDMHVTASDAAVSAAIH